MTEILVKFTSLKQTQKSGKEHNKPPHKKRRQNNNQSRKSQFLVTYFYLISKEPALACDTCNEFLTIEHIII